MIIFMSWSPFWRGTLNDTIVRNEDGPVLVRSSDGQIPPPPRTFEGQSKVKEWVRRQDEPTQPAKKNKS